MEITFTFDFLASSSMYVRVTHPVQWADCDRSYQYSKVNESGVILPH